MRKLSKMIAIAVLATSGHVASAADPVQYNLDTVFSGTAPSGLAPWLTATFSEGATDTVRLTLTTSVVSGYYVSKFFFNYDPGPSGAAVSALAFSTVGSNVLASDIKRAYDQWQADGDGKYDIRFDFAAGALYSGQQSVYDIVGTGVTPQSFKLLATAGGPAGPFFSAAQTGGPANGWIGAQVAAIPEPETYAMLLAGLGLMIMLARRRKKSL
ncbi:MAG: hypothetical protein A3G24_18305 [Betaproteobacteria bacterium RIFCSPLOWO2_12_FULL_62_13]|nr:MAG: hypothetical protein A3G24_18305 [Betaproteobacteria bacterium RIFCSPLOWO2_12_FULL_62_13]